LVIDHPYFGRIRFVAGVHWEAELVVAGIPEKVGVTVPAPESGPTKAQVAFCAAQLADLDRLFERCRPVFEGTFEEWAQKPFPRSSQDEFSLVGLDLPPGGDENEPWSVCYFVDAANHYFTAHFEHAQPSYLTVDG
jgi:hypothetical protein